MTSLVGTALLALVGAAALTAAGAWAAAARGAGTAGWERLGRGAAVLAWGAAVAAFLLLEAALLRGDTTVRYVAEVADPEVPTYYTVTSLWAGLEGSLLLWLLCLASVGALGLRLRGRLEPVPAAAALAVVALVVAAFAGVALVASPFAAAAAGTAATGPNPLLQDHPAMGVHPPLLYSGFAVLAVPFALSCAGLATRSTGSTWAREVRGWALAGWLLLSAGIVVGAWWSYAVLGWGGYWAWDPVENASLLPWLVTTALLHAVSAPAGRTAPRPWAAVLAGSAFLLVLLATFLTRSGVVESVHAFSTSSLGPLLLVVLLAALVPWLALVVSRRNHLVGAAVPLLSRQAVLRANAVLLVLVTATVLLGTTLPALLLATTGERISVGTPWYVRTLTPIAVALLVLMAIGPWVAWRRDDPKQLLHRVRVPALVGGLVVGGVGLSVPDLWLALVAGVAAFVLTTAVMRVAAEPRNRRRAGSALAHGGIALGAVAVVAGGHASTSQSTVGVGESVSAAGTTATLVAVERRDDGRRTIAEARVLLTDDADDVTDAPTWVHPQLRWYPRQQTMLAGPEIRVEPFRDVYVTLLDVDPAAGTATLRLAVTPLISWLWAAAGLTVLGGVVAGWPRRRVSPQPALALADSARAAARPAGQAPAREGTAVR